MRPATVTDGRAGGESRVGCVRRYSRGLSGKSRHGLPTDTTGMTSIKTMKRRGELSVVVLVVGTVLTVSSVSAGATELSKKSRGPCGTCGPCRGAAGTVTAYGDTGCGPRYCGAKHHELPGPDPCDACNRWRGCNGAHEMPDMLAPWQLPPGRGFQTAAEIGYAGNGGGGPCLECRQPIYRFW